MPKIAIKEIEIDTTIQIRRGNHEPTIRRYEESFEKLPPVDVFRTPEGDLLADGFHRVAAAERLGKREIQATIHKGTREAALEFAVTANMKNADPLSPEERDDGIRRLKQLHPAWSNVKMAEAMSIAETTVRNVFKIDEVKKTTFRSASYAYEPKDTHYREIARAPEVQRQSLVEAVQKRKWSTDATALAVQNLKDDRIPKQRKQAILKGKADPVVITPNGEFAVPADVVGRQIREMASNDAVLAMERALEALAKLRMFRADAIVSTIGRPRLDRLTEEMPGYIAFMQGVLDAAKKQGRKKELVR